MDMLHWNTVPPLRFSEFSGHWERKLLSDIGAIRTGPFGSLLHEKDYVDNGTPIITVEHLGDQGIQHVNLPLVSHEDKKRLSGYKLDVGDIVFSRVGSVDRNSIVTPKERGWLFSGRLLRIRLCQKNSNPKFLSLSLQQEYTKYRIRAVAVGQTMPSLNTEILKRFSLLLPPRIEEQQKIASFLSSVDTRIEQLEKKKSLFELYKKGLMQKIFSQEIRFKDEQGDEYPDWEETKLGNIAAIYDGTHQTPLYVKEGIPFYSVENVTADNFEDTKYISEESFRRDRARVSLNKGDVLMTRIGSVGVAKYIDWDVRASIYVSLALLKIPSEKKSQFIAQYISYQKFQRELWKRTIHAAFPKKINLGEIGNCLVRFPSEEELQKIANFLSSVDKKIELISEQIEKTREFKKGLLQQMFV